MNLEKKDMLYEGKAKKIFATNDQRYVILYYKDDATADNANVKGTIENKGVINNQITSLLFKYLKKKNIDNHYIETINDREQICHRLSIVPLEFIVRNIIAGSMAKRLGLKEGLKPNNTIFDICYKDDDLGDPLINDHHAVAMHCCSYDELDYMYKVTAEINTALQSIFLAHDIILVDFKIEFGKDHKGNILLADEITPDTCRLWDKNTMKKLDKDRFRRGLGNVQQAYLEILSRLNK